MVVAPDSGLVLFHGLSGKDIDLKEYLDAGYRSELNGPPQIGPAAPQKDWLLDLANRRYTSMVDLQAILSLKDQAQTLGSEVTVRYARDLRPNDFKTGTAILLGMSSANPWVELFERDMNFVLRDDYTKFVWVINRSPQKGEPARWETEEPIRSGGCSQGSRTCQILPVMAIHSLSRVFRWPALRRQWTSWTTMQNCCHS